VDVKTLPGRPDIVFLGARVVVFCDGDFWHGRDLSARLARLAAGHNAAYWIAKVQANVARDRRQTEALERAGWVVLRFWESTIRTAIADVAGQVAEVVTNRRARPR
jgi:DNA mismatch endonuclease (patch repair protein)